MIVSKPLIYAFGALLALFATVAVVYEFKNAALRVEVAEAKTGKAEAETKVAELEASIAKEREGFVSAARKKEQEHTQAMAELAQTIEEERNENAESERQLLADLAAERVRFHTRWRAAAATAELSATVAGAAAADAAARDREASAGRIVRAAADADTQITGLQRALQTTIQTCSGAQP